MPSVLHIYKDYYPPVIGGVEKHIHQIAQGASKKFDVRVLVANTRAVTETKNLDGVEVIKAASLGRIASAPICPGFPGLLKKYAADILHFHCPNPTGDLSYLKARPPGKVVVTYHSDVIRQKWAMFAYGHFLHRFLGAADAVLPTSPNYIESSPYLSRVSSKCTVTPLGIETKKFQETPETRVAAAQIRKECGNEPIILFVGRLRYYKGLHFLIQALPLLNARLIIVGAGPEEKNIRKQAEVFKVIDKIIFAGSVSDEDLVGYYHAADVFCLPSHLRSEAFGIVQLEAMASGTPVVSCNLDTGVPYVNRDEVTGLVTPPGSPQKLAEALKRLLENEHLKKKLGEQARRRVREEFDVDLMIKRIIEVYHRLLK